MKNASMKDAPRKRVVIIDDSEIVRKTVTDVLAAVDCQVVAMSEPSREVLLGSAPPDLVLVDVMMPESLGDDITRFFREAWGISAPIYLYSSLDEDELQRRSKESGADGYICKAWGEERMVSMVRQMLGLPSRTRSASEQGAGGTAVNVEQQMPADNHPDGIFERFARRCEDRKQKVLSLLEHEAAKDRDARTTLEAIGLELHDWVGESKLLGFDRVAATVLELDQVLRSWRGRVGKGTQDAQLRSWFSRLSDISRDFSLKSPNADMLHALQTLGTELRSELAGIEFEGEATPLPGEALRPQERRRILILDDSPIIGEMLVLELEGRGHAVVHARDLTEFHQRLVDFRPEIVFLDINMPEMQGDEVCRRLRREFNGPKVPIIFLSSLSDEELAALAQRAGANGYLSKQHGMDELVRYLDELLPQIIF